MGEERQKLRKVAQLKSINCLNGTNAHNLMDLNCTFLIYQTLSHPICLLFALKLIIYVISQQWKLFTEHKVSILRSCFMPSMHRYRIMIVTFSYQNATHM